MASYFTLTLDTKSPIAEIYAPNYTTRASYTSVVVEADEELSAFQDIYIVDSLGVRHDVILNHDMDTFEGHISLNDFPIGVATIYVTVEDVVGNRSEQFSKTIEIFESKAFKIRIDEMTNKVRIDETTNKVRTKIIM